MKKIISFTLAAITSLSLLTTVSAVTTMYAPDGRTAKIEDYEVQAWKNVGWYDYPVTTVYAPDGRTQVISKDAVSDWLNVGWYLKNYIVMYAPDGRSANVYLTDINAWKKVGWYDYPVIAVYAPDGRSQVISKDALYSWKNVGWYDYPVTTVYAPDGRSQVISKDALYSWKNVGWYDYPVTTVYALDGRSQVIATSAVKAWKKVGWYDYPLGYKRVYAHILKQIIATYGESNSLGGSEFSLAYIDNDDIPELLYHLGCGRSLGVQIYTYYNNSVSRLTQSWSKQFGEYSHICYLPKGNILISPHDCENVEGALYFYKISEGKAVLFKTLEHNNYYKEYSIDNIPVSYSEYIKTRKQYGFTGNITSFDGIYTNTDDTTRYLITYSNIKNVLGY